ncbi:MAG: AraC family transcriptional regulator [Christensenellales bacterium]|jgi:hypothetical protein
MTNRELRERTDWKLLTAEDMPDREITSGCCCDLLSWVMSSGEEGMAWITVHTHMNVIAVASLHDMACIILPHNSTMQPEVLEKAEEEGIAVFSAPDSGYGACCRLYSLGVAP